MSIIRKLGRKPVKYDPRTLKLETILPTLPVPPAWADWSGGITNYGMMLNDKIGDCTCACVGHMYQAWTQSESHHELTMSDNTILKTYICITGHEGAAYNPATGANDNGCAILDVMNHWRQMGIGGHKIVAYAQVDTTKVDLIKNGINLFGGLDTGVNLPISAQTQTDLWDVPASGTKTGNGVAGSWGGHSVAMVKYDEVGPTCITWGALQKMTWAFFLAYFEEAYAAIVPEWIAAKNVSPGGFDLNALNQYLAQL